MRKIRFTVTYYDSDGTTVLKTESLAYGATPSYVPKKDGYDFVAWTPNEVVTGDMSYIATWKEKPTFATASWEEIVAIAKAGNAASTFSVGDKRTDTINLGSSGTKTITWVVAGFAGKHGDVSYGKKDVNMAIVADCSLGSVAMGTTAQKYKGSQVQEYLNNYYFSKFPTALQEGAIEIKDGSGGINKCMALDQYELGLTATNSMYSSKLPLFSSNASRIRTNSNGEAVEYWTRDFIINNTATMCTYTTVTTTGTKGTKRADVGSYGMVPVIFL